ncbi:MAG: hypothetical protein M1812_003160 [Candelaria pacifica]|nr:MAG: hypothetical protein M1812_003160 [Candelaria pacifica]
MANNIPVGLKSLDISRFAHRAAQVEKAKPVVAYWCNFWIVNQILSKSLQGSDSDCMNYTLALMDKLEKTKADNVENDAIIDEVAGRAYVEQFGLETFQRADNAVRANKASRQTADTFQAAATFLDLSHIWGSPETELAAKSKYAKFHALRIAKAIKTGEDPNLSNPTPEPSPTQERPPQDPSDAELENLINETSGDQSGRRDLQPAVEDVPDEHDRMQRSLAANSFLDQSLHPSRSSSVPKPLPQQSPESGQDYPTRSNHVNHHYNDMPPADDVSPLEHSPPDRKGSEGGGYFSSIPKFPSDSNPSFASSGVPDPPRIFDPSDMSDIPPRPFADTHTLPGSQRPDLPSSNSFHSFPDPYPSAPPPPSQPSYPSQPPLAPSQPPEATLQDYYRQFAEAQQRPVPQQVPIPQQLSVPQQAPMQANTVVDEEAILKAQKHARWAISALNFEDVNTATKELRSALASLGDR